MLHLAHYNADGLIVVSGKTKDLGDLKIRSVPDKEAKVKP